MWWLILAWLVACVLCWAIIYGGSVNDPNRYEEGEHDNELKVEKENISNHDKRV